MFTVPVNDQCAFSWNVTTQLNLNHRTFAEARRWVHAYAAGYGRKVEEVVKPRKKSPTGNDAKVFRAGGCKEQWLSSDIPDLWAEAMVRCQHPGGHCGQDGFCHYGDCKMEMAVG
jgi:hypothetical protein